MTDRFKVLCVDDEPHILEGLVLHLRRHYAALTAPGGAAGLELLRNDPTVAVIVSDMRMPQMDGATFLRQSRAIAPNAVRVLLTGQTDIASAISAVNDGQIFRFLSKPCPSDALLATVAEAAEQHRLLTAEKVLLEQTLHGCIKALSDILALANPTSFGRALRIKKHVTDLANQVQLKDRWQVEVAAMFSQLGLITLPPDTADKLHSGASLSQEELDMVGKMPAVAEQLLANIPRLDDVREILAWSQRKCRVVDSTVAAKERDLRRCAHLLRVAIDFDALDGRGLSPAAILGTLRGRSGVYDPAMLDALEAVRSSANRTEVREVRLRELRPGMIFAEDVRLVGGNLLVARGYEITERFVERLANFSTGSVKEPIRVILPAVADKAVTVA